MNDTIFIISETPIIKPVSTVHLSLNAFRPFVNAFSQKALKPSSCRPVKSLLEHSAPHRHVPLLGVSRTGETAQVILQINGPIVQLNDSSRIVLRMSENKKERRVTSLGFDPKTKLRREIDEWVFILPDLLRRCTVPDNGKLLRRTTPSTCVRQRDHMGDIARDFWNDSVSMSAAAIRQLAYGTTPDAFDEYLQMRFLPDQRSITCTHRNTVIPKITGYVSHVITPPDTSTRSSSTQPFPIVRNSASPRVKPKRSNASFFLLLRHSKDYSTGILEDSPFCSRIIKFASLEYKMPTNVKLYDGTIDLEDHLSRFASAANSEEWHMPVCIDEWSELREAFAGRYSVRMECFEEPHDIMKIVRKENEPLTAFKERWTVETGFIMGVSEIMKIVSFMDFDVSFSI
nr:hypothetical protein [Tanacetum cinerariifolium]